MYKKDLVDRFMDVFIITFLGICIFGMFIGMGAIVYLIGNAIL